MVQWVELITKQLNSSNAACEWLLDHMATNHWWPMTILIACPNQMVRQMFHRLCIHVIQRLRASQSPMYLYPISPVEDEDSSDSIDLSQVGNSSCVTRFIKKLLSLVSAKEILFNLIFS